MTDFAFKGRTQNKMFVNNYGIIIRNCCFTIADPVFQQVFGISM